MSTLIDLIVDMRDRRRRTLGVYVCPSCQTARVDITPPICAQCNVRAAPRDGQT